MNRPYYALAAMLAVLSGSAVAVGPANYSRSSSQAAISSRYLCGTNARTYTIATNVFVLQIEDTSEADDVPAYDESCGYDAERGEQYQGAEEAEWSPFPKHAGTFAEEVETWPTDERIEAQFSEFRRQHPVCGGDELHCPYFAGTDETSNDVAEVHLGDEEETSDESAFFGGSSDDMDWKVNPVQTPDWIEDYVNGENTSTIEAQYAQAEIEAAHAAGQLTESVANLPASPTPNLATYESEYESLFELDELLSDDADESVEEDESGDLMEEESEAADNEDSWSEEDDEAPETSRPFSRLIRGLLRVLNDILPAIEEEADEIYDSAESLLDQVQEAATRLTIALPVTPEEPYSKQVSSDDFETPTYFLPEQAAEHREAAQSVAEGLCQAGELLMTIADGIELHIQSVE